MKDAQEYYNDIEGAGYLNYQISLEGIPQARQEKKRIIVAQKHLRQIKREVNLTQKQVRAEFSQRSTSAGSGLSTVFSLFGKRKIAGQFRAAAKSDLRAERDNILNLYNNVKNIIDEILIEMDRIKIDLDEYILDEQNA